MESTAGPSATRRDHSASVSPDCLLLLQSAYFHASQLRPAAVQLHQYPPLVRADGQGKAPRTVQGKRDFLQRLSRQAGQRLAHSLQRLADAFGAVRAAVEP